MLNLTNTHVNDTRVFFDSKNHEYFVDGKKINYSVTGLIESFFPEFDSDYWSDKKAIERIKIEGGKLTDENIYKVKKDILMEWEENRKDAADKGTILHEKIENFYNNIEDNLDAPEFTYFKNFIQKYPKLKPYKTEWRIFDSNLSLAGSIDMVYEKDNGDLFLFDWKRSTKIINGAGHLIESDYDYGFDELSHIADNSYNRYSLQLNLYKYIIESNYGKKISSMNLLILHPHFHTFFHLQIPDLEKETKFLITAARNTSN
ncbi:MAG: hypothetical protein ACJ0PK_06040 [Flavobacteriaceae bacterium]